jgi:hypothetical protein
MNVVRYGPLSLFLFATTSVVLAQTGSTIEFFRVTSKDVDRVSLEWKLRGGSATVDSVELFRETEEILSVGFTTDTSQKTDSSLHPNIAYRYVLKTLKSSGVPDSVDTTVVTLARSPTDLEITYVAETTVELQWQHPDSNASKFKVYFREDSAQDFSPGEATQDSVTFNLLVNGLNANTQYYFRMHAVNSSGDTSHPSEVRDTVTLARKPTNLTAMIDREAQANSHQDSVKLSWTGSATMYRVELQKIGQPDTFQADTSETIYRASIDTGRYSYSVMALNLVGVASDTAHASLTVGRRIHASLGSIDFNIVRHGFPREDSLQLRNTDSLIVRIDRLEQVGPDSGFKVDTSGLRQPILPGGVLSLEITFNPPDRGLYTDTLRIHNNSIDSLLEVILVGTGINPKLGSVDRLPQNANVNQPVTLKINPIDYAKVSLVFKSSDKRWVEADTIIFDKDSMFDKDSAVIPGISITSKGLDYRIIGEDTLGIRDTLRNTSYPSLSFFSVPISVPANDDTIRSFTSSGGTQVTNYRLFSVPIKLDHPRFDSLLMTAGLTEQNRGADKQWRLLGFSGAITELSASDPIEQGEAYLLITRTPREVLNTSGVTSRLDTLAAAGLRELKGGWNLVGNPFPFPIPKRVFNDTELLDTWELAGSDTNNGWVTSKVLNPWHGWAVYVVADTALRFADPEDPFRAASGGPDSAKLKPGEWVVSISASVRGFEDKENVVGVKQGATEGYEAFAKHEPPVLPGGVSLYLPHNDWKAKGIYASDIRPPTSQGYVWSFEVVADEMQEVTLSFENIELIPAMFGASLIDKDHSASYNLRDVHTLTTNSDVGLRRFDLVIGTDQFIRDNSISADLVPATFQLEQNYPNPFNPVTVLRYQSPIAGWASLKVYNLLGQEVAALVDENRREGYYEMRFDGSGFASGVYFYRLSVSGKQQTYSDTKKMILLR